MLDSSVAGEIFAAPGAVKCIEAIRDACAGGESALLIVLNHAGDVLTANIAMQADGARTPEREDGAHAGRHLQPGRAIAAAWWAALRSTRWRVLQPKTAPRWRNASKWRSAWRTTCAPSRWRCAPPPIPPPASPSLSSATTKWKSAWASTAKPAPAACS